MTAANRLRQISSCIDIFGNEKDAILGQGNGLCGPCQEMDFVSLTSEACPNTDDDRHFHLGPIKHLLAKRSCPGCRLILATVGSIAQNKVDVDLQTLTIRRRFIHAKFLAPNGTQPVSGNDETECSKYDVESHMESLIEVNLQLLDQPRTRVTGTIIRSESPPTEDAFPSANESKEPAIKFRSRVVPSTVSISLVKHWIELCHTDHIACPFEDPTISKSNNIRLIDIQEQRVINASQTERYAALSYVWGPTTAPMLTRSTLMLYTSPCGLKQCSIPRSIFDTIQFLREVGVRFLWVDTLCIIQDDHTEKVQQLSIMDSIFQSAYLVIVAAAGSDANAGLPGVQSTRHTQQQQRETINGVQFITAQPAVRHALEETEWNTRGWTFQELLMARRLLVFTENQVYWSCRTSSWREDATGELSTAVINADESNSFWTRSARRVECPTYTYCSDVVNFSKRVFKDDRDVLWGFMGILKLHASCFPQGFIWGMPCEQLDATLLWDEDLGCYNVHKRRTYHPLAKERSTGYLPYPSWSWLSTSRAVSFMDRCGCSIVSEVSWHRPLLFGDSKKHRDIPSKDITGYGFLQFTAQTVELLLVREEKSPFEQAFISEPEDHPRIDNWVETALYTPSRHAIGSLKVPNSFFNGGLERSGELLLLSSNAEVCLENIPKDPSDNITYQRCVIHTRGCMHIQSHNIMLIEWVDGIAYRRGLGRVEKANWAQVETREKHIILG